MTQKIPKQTIRYLIIEDTLKVFADNSIYKYKNTPIGLLLLSTENPKTWQTYITCPPIMIPFALHIGDSIISTYQSTGNYCNDYSIKSQGTIVAKCIGIGKLKDSDNEILDNILLFYRNNISFAYASPKNEQKRNPNLSKIKKEEKIYFWTNPKTHEILYQYQIQKFSVGNIQLSCKHVFHKYEYETTGGELKDKADENFAPQTTFHIQKLEVKKEKLLIEYECTENDDIKIQVCNIAGITYKRFFFRKKDIQPSGSLCINLPYLSRGTYIAIIYFKGNIYKKTFNL